MFEANIFLDELLKLDVMLPNIDSKLSVFLELALLALQSSRISLWSLLFSRVFYGLLLVENAIPIILEMAAWR